MLRTHYRQPIDWTEQGLIESLSTYFDLLELAERYIPTAPDDVFVSALTDDLNTPMAIARLHELARAAKALDEGAGGAFAASFHLVGFGQKPRPISGTIPQPELGTGAIVSALMGAFPRNYPAVRALAVVKEAENANEIPLISVLANAMRFARAHVSVGQLEARADILDWLNERIIGRLKARTAKDWKESDRIRDELLAKGIQLKDNPDGTTSWEVKR